jgi:hypothetical protein
MKKFKKKTLWQFVIPAYSSGAAAKTIDTLGEIE